MKNDRRIVKTKKAAHSAFINLLNTNDLETITITDICKLADINRKTFYNHYSGIYQLIDEIEDEIVNKFEELLDQYNINDILNDPRIFFNSMNHVIKDNYEEYIILVSSNYSTGLVTKIVDALKERTSNFFINSKLFDIEHIDYVVTYTISGLVSLYQTVFERNDFDLDSDFFSSLLRNIVMNGITGIMLKE